MSNIRCFACCKRFLIFLFIGALLGGCSPEPLEQTRADVTREFEGIGEYFSTLSEAFSGDEQQLYLPVYSHIYLSNAGRRELATTLSIRNMDAREPVTITRVEFYNSAGQLVERYLKEPHRLAPMASTTLVVPQSDTRGGAGANFLIGFSADDSDLKPLVQALMAGVSGTHSISFTSDAVLLTD